MQYFKDKLTIQKAQAFILGPEIYLLSFVLAAGM
jgi:hypothetical protein